MAKRARGKRRRNNGVKLPIAVVAGFIPGVARTLTSFQTGGWQGATQTMGQVYLGYDWLLGKWNPSTMWYGTAPLVLGLIVHKMASMLGINRALGQARIPFIRI